MADSVNDAATMENHASRPEVAAALAGDVGCAKRVSRTDGIEYLYLAIPATYQGSPCVLRVSETVSAVNAMAQDFRTASLVLLCIAIALAVAAAVVSFLRISRPVSHLERTRTDFVANASHELKTPIAGIALLAESIEQASADNDMEHVALFARQLKAETEHLHSLVIDLASLSRLESRRRAAPGKKTCDACAIVLASFESRRVLAEGKGLSMVLDNEIPAGETCTARISADNMTLVIDNLLDNAIRYTNTGSVTTALSQTPDEVSISVIDTGIGIPLEDQERVFERFYRVDKSHLRGGTGGTGLGLSLVRHAVKDAHGSIQLESMPGRGSIFIVKIPRA